MTAPVPILMYHAVSEAPPPATYALSVTPHAFADQVALLAEDGFTPMTTAELADRWRGGRPLPARPVLITFDDGYAGVHEHALPTLAAYGFTATVFVSTGWLRGAYDNRRAPDLMLDWTQLRELATAGLEVGGHSHSHPQLDQLAEPFLRGELTLCRELLTAETGRCPVSFAYPYGYSDRRVREAVRTTGFRQSLAVGNSLADKNRQGPYDLNRLTLRRSISLTDFTRLLNGHGIARTYAADRFLTKGYAVLRGARRAAGKARRVRD